MVQRQENFHEVIRRVLAHFKKHPTLWAAEPIITARIDRLGALDSELEATAQGQAGPGTGAFSVKDDLLEEAADRTELMATRLRSLARHSGDPLLEAGAAGPSSAFRHGAQADRIRNMRHIVALAETNAAAALRFKVRPEDIAALKDLLDRAAAILDTGRDSQTDRTGATARIPRLLSEARAELDALDDDVPALLDEHPDFVENYFISRRVHDRRGSHSGPVASSSGA